MNPNSSGDSNNRNSHLNVQGDEAPPPPYSETDVYSNSGSSRSPHPATAPAATPSHSFVDDAASSTAGDTIYTPPLTPRTSSGSGQPAAALYFDLRPVPQQNSIPREAIIHTIEVNDASRPDDFPFQNEWAARDITTLDWSTFINFLIPDHTTRENEAIIHRKLLDEVQSSAGHSNDSATQVEAQLGHVADTGIAPNPDAVQRRRDVESTVRQWNDGFFGPRGIEIRLEPLRTTPAHMPGAWEANFDQRSEPGQSTQPPQTTGRSGPAGWGPWANLQIDNNGVRYGNGFVADSNGLRIGNLVMDHNGIRFQNDGSQDQQQQQNERDIRGRAAHQQGGSYPNEKDGHKRSSSCSSSSSSSSSSSASSIGSLPSYDDVPQSSIQLYINRLQDWTKNPDQLRTRSDIKQLKAELKSVPKNRDVDLEVDKKALRAQIKALTAAWRHIKKAQRKERRSRKRERRERRRAERRERRQHKREMKRARRDARRCGATPVPPVPGPPPPPCIPPMPPHPPAHAVPSVPPVPPVPPVQPPPWSGGFPWGRGRGRGEHHHDPRHHDPHHNPHHHGPHRGGWGSWSNGRPPRGRGRGDNGMFGSRGPFGGDGPFGPSGPFGPEGPFGSGGPFGPGGPFGEKGIFGGGGGGPFGLFGSNSEEQQRQQQEQQRQQQQGLQQQYQEHRRQYQEHQRQHQEQQQQHQEQHRQHQEQHRQHQEQHRQHQEQQQEQMRQQLQQLQQLQQQLHQSSGSSSRSVPGSWPDEKKDPSTSTLQDDQQVPLPGPVASAKYRAMEDIETAIHHHLAAAEEAEPGPAKEALEKSIAEMMKKLEFMRVEADEEYARELSDR